MLTGTRGAINALIILKSSPKLLETKPLPKAIKETTPLTNSDPNSYCPTCKQAIPANAFVATPPGGYYMDPRASNAIASPR